MIVAYGRTHQQKNWSLGERRTSTDTSCLSRQTNRWREKYRCYRNCAHRIVNAHKTRGAGIVVCISARAIANIFLRASAHLAHLSRDACASAPQRIQTAYPACIWRLFAVISLHRCVVALRRVVARPHARIAACSFCTFSLNGRERKKISINGTTAAPRCVPRLVWRMNWATSLRRMK